MTLLLTLLHFRVIMLSADSASILAVTKTKGTESVH